VAIFLGITEQYIEFTVDLYKPEPGVPVNHGDTVWLEKADPVIKHRFQL
jgi:hypothetical protein